MKLLMAFGQSTSVGKDVACLAISERLGAVRLKFSDEIKDVAYQLFGKYGLKRGPYYEEPGRRPLRQDPLPRVGKSPEDLWIEVGNHMREIYAPVWADQGMSRVMDDGRLYLFSDVRSSWEAQAVLEAGGLLVKIERPGQRVLKADTLIPDDWPGWHVKLVNDGTQEKLETLAVELAVSFLEKKGV